MHKLLYTAAIPLLISNVMAGEFVNSLSVIDEEFNSSASSLITTPTNEQNDQIDGLQNGILEPHTTLAVSPVTLDDQRLLLTSTTLPDFHMPNLATNLAEERTTHVGATISMISSAGMAQLGGKLHLTGDAKGRISLTINPDHTVGWANTPLDEIIADGGTSLALNVILNVGYYSTGIAQYIVAKSYAGAMPAVLIETQAANEVNGLSARTELVPTEEGLAQLLLKLTITEPFTITEAEEDDFGDYQEPTAQVSVAGTNNIVQESDAL
jgi:hypothetical protein